MKKSIIVLFVLLFCFLNHAYADPWRVFDNASIIPDEEEAFIENAISDFQRCTNIDFVILTTDDYLGSAVTYDVAKLFYEKGAFGFGTHQDGIVYHIDMSNTLTCFFIKGGAVDKIGRDGEAAMHEKSWNFLKIKDYTNAVLSVISEAKSLIE